ncbi:molybdopterin molybdotransferase MoeA [Streptomyces nigrescens]|uniref:Molybdopterin molybdenumtransferase n=1 Tax=Streptomyces nigrescens TaxID=1920 RepID=A0ABY7J426_STRNI|nr:molybdopterin molybdotransferase MoeA [Streptomyces nigrescens]WAU05918.1 molybdopterin molybdotransferase MoeA [Streptomyces nigrescens]
MTDGEFSGEPGGAVGRPRGGTSAEGRGDPFDDALALANGTAPRWVRPGAGPEATTVTTPYAAGGAAAATSSATGSGGDAPYTPDDPFSPDDPAAARSGPSSPSSPSGPSRPVDPAPPTGPGPRTAPAAVPWHTARALAERAVPGPPAPETSVLGEALGRTLAAPLSALTDLPSFDTSAMDGWAVSGPGPWRLDRPADAPETGLPSGILAGHAPAEALLDGHAIPIATGARVPSGATAVLRSEHGEVRELSAGGRRLYAPRPAPPGQDIRPRGQECRRGDQLLPAGALVTPAVLGLAAAAGYDELTAYRRPRAEVFVLGDELLDHGLPHEGRIRDALGPMLAPWLHSLGIEAAPPRHLADEADTLYAALAGSTADVVITTGGTASGPVDHVHPTLRRLGAEVLVDGVAVRPGHPMLLARLAPRRHLVGLPGNPLAAVSGLLTLAEPLLRTLAARRPAAPYRTPLAAAVAGHPRDTRLVPVAYRDDERHGLTAVPLRFHGPAMLRGIASADALAVVPPGGAERGTELELLEFPWSASWSAGWTPGWAAPGGPYEPPEATGGRA